MASQLTRFMRHSRPLRILTTPALLVALGVSGCSKPEPGPELESPPDVFLIVIDTLRPDHLNTYGYERDTAPALARLAADGVVFEEAFAAAPKTIPSIPQTLSSSYFPDSRRARTLMATAADSGYDSSLAVINNPYVKKWIERLDPTFEEVVAGDISATEIVDTALEWLADPERATDDKPQLVYLHILDTHTPYDVPMPFKSLFVETAYQGPVGLEFRDVAGAWSGKYSAADQQRIVDLYDGTIAYVDEQVGRFMTALSESGRYHDALVIVTSDHGEEFWEHGSFFHGQSLYDELLRVPLIVKYPGGWKAGSRSTELASTLDILPTMAGLMSPGKSDARWQGMRLTQVLHAPTDASERVLFSTVGRADRRRPPRHAVRTKTHKLIVNVADGTKELYELIEDPHEHRSISSMGIGPPENLLSAYEETTAELSEVGYQFRLSNPADRKVGYDLEIKVKPPAPIVNLHRIEMEGADRMTVAANAASLHWTGRLTPGDSDRLRFDLLALEGELEVTLAIDGHLADAETLLIGAAGDPADANPALIDIGTIDGPPSGSNSAKRALRAVLPATEDNAPTSLEIWRTGDDAHILPPSLSEEESERIRALGYIE